MVGPLFNSSQPLFHFRLEQNNVTSDEHEKHDLINGHPEIARDLAAKLSDWTSRLAPPGDPDHLLNDEEKRWYQYYLGLTD
jgi:hypothetical protein